MSLRSKVPLLLALLVPTAVACATEDEISADLEADLAQSKAPKYLEQGWSADERESFYFANQGGRILPYEWFRALEQPYSTKPFTDPANLRSFGTLVDGASKKNPDGLPIGFTRDDDPEAGSWVGLTCAACHTATYEYKGKQFRVDGAQGRFELGEFFVAVSDALGKTLDQSAKFDRFAKRVLGDKASLAATDALRAEVQAFQTTFTVKATRLRGPRRLGPGRFDSLNTVFNQLLCTGIGVPENCQENNMASATPALWLTGDLDWVQTNGNQHIPLPRDVVQALGLGHLKMSAAGVEHSVNVPAIRAIEGQVKTLTAPKWPEQVFGRIDRKKAEAGKMLYETHCADCHSLPPYARTGADMTIPVKRIPIAEAGVDPAYVKNHLGRRALPGLLAGQIPPEQIGPDGKVNALILSKAIFGAVIGNVFASMGATPAQQAELLDHRQSLTPTPQDLQTVVARPLPGVALSGYYLHNGSVRTIHQLLLPPAQRERSFWVGGNEYDPEELGYVSDRKAKNAFEFRVDAAQGDDNGGHDYGTALDERERRQLLEFIKTL